MLLQRTGDLCGQEGRSLMHDTLPPTLAERALPKAPTGIKGLDEITEGGLPRGRTTLVCGAAGCGKTLLGIEFLVHGATRFDEPGLLASFEETAPELTSNVASLGFDLQDLQDRGRLAIDHVHIERSEIEETGEFDLDGLFIRLGFSIDRIGAKRVVLDTLEALFSGLPNEAILRAELRRLFRWLKDKGVTAVITAERGTGALTRHGLEEYVSDCVLLLDHRVHEQISTRRIRIVKYRGSAHGTNEYPFLIDHDGFSVFPVTSLSLDHEVSEERVSTGIPRLDALLGTQGCHRGSSILVSGTAGTGKSSIAVHVAQAACARGERALYFAFEESPQQIMRNMRSIGVDLRPYVARGLLAFHAARPTLFGLEAHLAVIYRLVVETDPGLVVMDPITNLIAAGSRNEVQGALLRLIDFLKGRGITTVFTSLTEGGVDLEQTQVGISSLMDVWIALRTIEERGERNRGLYILKARGTPHSNQIREFRITEDGIDLVDVYLGPAGVLTGTARYAQEARERAEAEAQRQRTAMKRREIERRRQLLEAQIASLRAEVEAGEEDLQRLAEQDSAEADLRSTDREALARLRQAD
jgi:circadian clock protein KaiC